jgi:hypothetical protein
MRSDRRSFFRNVAGGAAAVAGVEALRGSVGKSAAVAATRSVAAGRFALELDGKMAGSVSSAEGGDATAEVLEQSSESCTTQAGSR